jgi:hypothetical protein
MVTTNAERSRTDRSRPDPIPIRSSHEHGPLMVALPLPLTSFVGREREVAAIAELLRPEEEDAAAPHAERAVHARRAAPGARLVTLTGPGGVGKTRLALRVAAESAGAFPDGVWFVPFAAVRDRAEPATAAVAATVAQALGLRETKGQSVVATVAAYLRPRTALLILDNFESVVAAAPLVTELLTACQNVSALATSRERLRVSGEHEVACRPCRCRPRRRPPPRSAPARRSPSSSIAPGPRARISA